MRVLRIVAMLVLAAALNFGVPPVSEVRDVSEEIQEVSHGSRRRPHQHPLIRETSLPPKAGQGPHESIQPRSRSTSVWVPSLAGDHRPRKVPPSSADSASPSDDH